MSKNARTMMNSQRQIWISSVLTVASLCALNDQACASDKDTIATDRPDFVESSNVVGKGRFQFETSFAIDKNDRYGIREKISSTPTLLRYGFHDNLEFRLETDGFLSSKYTDRNRKIDQSTNGFSDTSIGLKWHVADAEANTPSIGILVHADLDSGSRAFRGQGIRPSIRAVAEWELANDFSLGVMPGLMSQKNDNGDRFVSGIFGIVLGKAWTDKFRSFVELAAPQIASSKNGGVLATLDVGVAYLLTPTVQIDTALSKGLNKNTSNLSWTIGISAKY
jgi:hypothetical protein